MRHILPNILTSSTLPVTKSKQITLFFPVQQILSGTLSFVFNATHCSAKPLGIGTKKDEDAIN